MVHGRVELCFFEQQCWVRAGSEQGWPGRVQPGRPCSQLGLAQPPTEAGGVVVWVGCRLQALTTSFGSLLLS